MLSIGKNFMAMLSNAGIRVVDKLPEQYRVAMYVAIKYYMMYLVDQDYIFDSMIWSVREFFPALEEKGLYLRRNSRGELVTNTDKSVVAAFFYKYGFTGTALMDMKRKEVKADAIRVLEETSVTTLLMNNGQCVGALAVDYARGHVYVIKAKSTILATGHTNWLATRATGTREQAGNGFAMAFRAGCELKNMEMQWWHCTDTHGGPSAMGPKLHNYPSPLPATDKRLQMINTDGEVFYDSSWNPLAGAPYIQQMKALYKQVKAGKSQWDGGFYGSYKHIDQNILKDYLYHYEHYKKLGYDMSKDTIECGASWHMSSGGVECNPKSMETSLPGLYVAGSVSANFLGGIQFVCYDGYMAGKNAAERAKITHRVEVDDAQVKGEVERITGFLTNSDKKYVPMDLKEKIRKTMWNYMGFVKSETSIKTALDELKAIREDMLPRMYARSSGKFNYDLIDAIDVPDMLDACEMASFASLERHESRGPFFREEYPFTDNKNWLKYIVVRKGNGGMKARFEPVNPKYLRPEQEKADYFTVDY